jgi:hypothetical protein
MPTLENTLSPETGISRPERAGVLDAYLTAADLASELGVSERSIARWRALRTGPAWTAVGKRILYRRSAVAAWLKSREQKPARQTRRRPGAAAR